LSFLFSLRNNEKLAPFIANLVPGNEHYAIYCKSNHGPSFGGGHDLHISNNANGNQESYSKFGNYYQRPPGTAQAEYSLLVGSRNFTPTEIEVFI
jgi:hypothetical protein